MTIGAVLGVPFVKTWRGLRRCGSSSYALVGKVHEAWINLSPSQQTGVTAWFWYSMVLGLLPLIFSLGAKYIANTDSHPIRYGDLYLLAALLAFAGVGSMFQAESGATSRLPRVSFVNTGGRTLIVGVIDAFLYATVAASSHPHNIAVDITSAVLYVVSALCSLGCVLASGGKT